MIGGEGREILPTAMWKNRLKDQSDNEKVKAVGGALGPEESLAEWLALGVTAW